MADLRDRLVASVSAAWGYQDTVPALVGDTVNAILPAIEGALEETARHAADVASRAALEAMAAEILAARAQGVRDASQAAAKFLPRIGVNREGVIFITGLLGDLADLVGAPPALAGETRAER